MFIPDLDFLTFTHPGSGSATLLSTTTSEGLLLVTDVLFMISYLVKVAQDGGLLAHLRLLLSQVLGRGNVLGVFFLSTHI
jgi:hypothetical protein